MKTLHADILTAMTDLSTDPNYKASHLIKIEGGAADILWTDALDSITYDGDTYEPQTFSVGDVVTEEEGTQAVSITVLDVDRVFRGLLYDEDWSSRPMTLREVWRNSDLEVIEAHILASGRAEPGPSDFEDDAEPIQISIVPDDEAEGAPGPAQEFSSKCRYIGTSGFKGPQCGYAGVGTTCDGRRTTCVSYGNEVRFGGFRFAPVAGSTINVGVSSQTVVKRG